MNLHKTQRKIRKIPAIESRYADLAANYLEVLRVLEDLSSSHHHIHRHIWPFHLWGLQMFTAFTLRSSTWAKPTPHAAGEVAKMPQQAARRSGVGPELLR